MGGACTRIIPRATGTDLVEVLGPENLGCGADDPACRGHVFIRFRDRFYDAETPQGVSDWRQLPLFVRQREDAPSKNMERFVEIVGRENAKTKAQVLQRFKRAARAYIKWAHSGDEQGSGYDEDDLLKLKRAKTFEEAEAILGQYETEPSFLSMVAQGYFA